MDKYASMCVQYNLSSILNYSLDVKYSTEDRMHHTSVTTQGVFSLLCSVCVLLACPTGYGSSLYAFLALFTGVGRHKWKVDVVLVSIKKGTSPAYFEVD